MIFPKSAMCRNSLIVTFASSTPTLVYHQHDRFVPGGKIQYNRELGGFFFIITCLSNNSKQISHPIANVLDRLYD